MLLRSESASHTGGQTKYLHYGTEPRKHFEKAKQAMILLKTSDHCLFGTQRESISKLFKSGGKYCPD